MVPEVPPKPASWTLRLLRPVAEAIFTTEDGPPPPDRLDWLLSEAGDFLSRGGPQIRLTFRLVTLALTVVAPLFVGRLGPFGRLPLETRIRALELLENSALGAPVLAAKAMLCVVYYEHPEATAIVGYDAGCMTAPSLTTGQAGGPTPGAPGRALPLAASSPAGGRA